MRWLKFIFSHSIFISLCATALCFQTEILLKHQVDPLIYLLVFSSTLCSYNFYWLLSKFHFRKTNDLKQFISANYGNLLLAGISTLIIIYSLIQIPEVFPYLIIGVLLTFLYSLPLWPGKFIASITGIGFMKTVLLALTWTYVTIVLPVYDKLEIDPSFALLFTARFAFMLMLCAIFDSRDKAMDQINGLRSLATDVSLVFLNWVIISLFSVYIGAGILLRLNDHNPIPLISFLISGITLLIIYLLSRKPRGYFFYYFVVDGLMLFSTLSTYMATII